MTYFTDEIFDRIIYELKLIWAGHLHVGLEGKMCLYTQPEQDPWRAKNASIRHWFGSEDKEITDAVRELRFHFDEGHLPNSPLLLNPLVHQINEHGSYEPIGSGVIWCTSFALGVNKLHEDSIKRIRDLGVYVGIYERGENSNAGMKMLAFSDVMLTPEPDKLTVKGNQALYDIANVDSPAYWKTYPLSDIEYLSKNGSFVHHNLRGDLGVTQKEDFSPAEKTLTAQSLMDAATCWEAYDRHHALYEKFGVDPNRIDHNLSFFNLVARDISLFEATGTDRKSKDEAFEFFVEGWLPKGSVTVMGATGGTGKSSLAHRLAIMASIDWRDDEEPKWLGMPINKQFAKGLVIYFSGEDSAAIVNARAQMVDPEGRSTRLMLQRNDFGMTADGKRCNIGHFLEKLKKLPEVSLIVIDPARKYLEGDEEDSEVVSNFFEAIEDFAIEKKCGMVVVHHLIKNAHPKDTRDIYDMLRGSQVFIDRPRAVIGMMREGPYTVVGLSKNNIPPNLGSIQGERLFVRDPDRLDLVQLPGKEGIRLWDVSAEELREIREEAERKASES
jgi:hypothetical protein